MRKWLACGILSLCSVGLSSCSNSVLDAGDSYTSVKISETLKQETVHKNSCGPCAVVLALAGSGKKSGAVSLKAQALAIIEENKSKESSHYRGRRRWSFSKGMRSLDLKDVLEESSGREFKLFETAKGQSESDLSMLRRNHKAMVRSMRLGCPPVLSLKCTIYRKFNSEAGYYWIKTKGHYVVLQSIPKTLAKKAKSFDFYYIDPDDGAVHQGRVYAKSESLLATSPISRQKKVRPTIGLTAHFPELKIANQDLPARGKQILVVDAIIGAY